VKKPVKRLVKSPQKRLELQWMHLSMALFPQAQMAK
jgi:hypothetical protein